MIINRNTNLKTIGRLFCAALFLIAIQSDCLGQIAWSENIEEAQLSEKDVIVYFTSVSCKPCRKMEKYVFADPKFIEFAADYEMVKVTNDFDHKDVAKLNYWKKVTREYNIQYYPIFYLLRKGGKPVYWAGATTKTERLISIFSQLMVPKT